MKIKVVCDNCQNSKIINILEVDKLEATIQKLQHQLQEANNIIKSYKDINPSDPTVFKGLMDLFQ